MFLKTLIIFLLIFTTASANESKLFKKGEKLYNILCDKKSIEAIKYKTKEELTLKIKDKNYCKNIDDKKLQIVVIYLTQKDSRPKTIKNIIIPKDAKCLVCGMFVAKYPKWVATIKEKDGKIHYFDGVKDMMKYYLSLKGKKIDLKEIMVNDYYTLQPIIAQDATFVIGSNIYGPMGSELIPFKTLEDAKSFSNEHHGEKIVKFYEINRELVQ